jgi:glycosyltransferase involved in cell wall biosynthesis
MKKVVVFRSELLPRSETFILEQVRALTDWTPTLVGYRKVADGLALDGIDVRILPGLNAGRWRRWFLRTCQYFGVAHPPTVSALRRLAPDLIHAHFGLDAVDLWPSACKLRVPTLVTLHGFDINTYREWWEAGHGGPLRRSYPRRLLRMANNPAVHFIAVSKAIKLRAVEYGIPEQKITVAYIGVDTNRFRPGGLPLDQRRKRILFVGRMVEKKAPLLMVRAFAEVRKSVPDAELVMIGAGPLLEDAKALANELSAPVEFLGARNSDEVLANMHEARVFCLPSVTAANGDAEGFGLVILEAQACGLPVVTSAKGGANEGVIASETGSIFNEGDATALVSELKEFLLNDARAMNVTVRSAQFIRETYEIRSCSRQLALAYNQLMD